jgi:ABC-type proline/glycine betaine transport system ATPase subunit
MQDHKIINLGEPRELTDAATMRYVSRFSHNALNAKVDWQGGVMQGALDLDNHKIVNLPPPQDPADAATKQYVDERNAYAVGRYIVLGKTYFSVRTKKA